MCEPYTRSQKRSIGAENIKWWILRLLRARWEFLSYLSLQIVSFRNIVEQIN